MKLVGYIDGVRSFVRDEVKPQDATLIAAHIKELSDFHKKRLKLFVEVGDVIHMFNPMEK